MKAPKTIGLVLLAVLAAAVLIFVLMAHSDEMVNGAALTDAKITDMKVLDQINASKGKDINGFAGTIYETSCIEYGKYVYSVIQPVPEGKDLYANVYFMAVPKGIAFKAIWTRDGNEIKNELYEITSDQHKELGSFVLEGSYVTQGKYTFEIDYADKQIYTQAFSVN